MQNFSVIIPVYELENADFLSQAIISIINQSRAPDEIIVVVDGPICAELESIIKNFIDKNEVIVIRLNENKGPGAARHAGILKSKNNIIALMDSDDISRSDRFEKQLDALINEKVDAVGGWIEEFNTIPGDLNRFRITPASHKEIVLYSKWRMPVNNVTLIFKKEAYINIGGYKSMRQVEDFDLILRMLISGVQFINIQKVLVDVRVGNEVHNRRRGVKFLTDEISVFREMYSSGYIDTWQYICNIMIRLTTRLLPSKIILYLYTKLFRKNTQKS
jgi:glycosyltransferase involved in cell wall biosynthesis